MRFSVSLNLGSSASSLSSPVVMPPPPIPFEASRLKLERAKQHTRELEAAIAAYMAKVPAYVRTWLSPDGQYVEHEFVPVHDVPSRLSPIIGDAVHNLRVSLDLLAIEVVGHNPMANTNGVYFPFAKSAADLETAIKDKNFHRAADAAVDLLRSLKPYPEGNPSLRYVHDLDIMDKHKALLPVAGHVHLGAAEVGYGVPQNAFMHMRGSGSTWLSLAWERGLLPDQKFPALFKLQFPWNSPLADRELVPTLDNLAEDFSAIVDAFENLLLGTVSKLSPAA